MKKLLFTALMLCSFFTLQAQDLSNATLSAHYTLIETDTDEIGNYGVMTLTNAPYQGQDGVYAFGGYLFDVIDTDSSLISTPDIDALTENAYAIQLECRFDSLAHKPIIIAGDGWRYLGMGSKFDSTFMALHNGIYYDTQSEKIEIDRWYLLTMIHDATELKTDYFVDNELVFSKSGALDNPGDDLNIGNSHYGNGEAFRGNWRNLKVFTGDLSTSIYSLSADAEIKLYPNPFSSLVTIEGKLQPNATFSIFDVAGKLLLEDNLNGDSVDLSFLEDAVYFVKIEYPDQRSIVKMLVKQGNK